MLSHLIWSTDSSVVAGSGHLLLIESVVFHANHFNHEGHTGHNTVRSRLWVYFDSTGEWRNDWTKLWLNDERPRCVILADGYILMTLNNVHGCSGSLFLNNQQRQAWQAYILKSNVNPADNFKQIGKLYFIHVFHCTVSYNSVIVLQMTTRINFIYRAYSFIIIFIYRGWHSKVNNSLLKACLNTFLNLALKTLLQLQSRKSRKFFEFRIVSLKLIVSNRLVIVD